MAAREALVDQLMDREGTAEIGGALLKAARKLAGIFNRSQSGEEREWSPKPFETNRFAFDRSRPETSRPNSV